MSRNKNNKTRNSKQWTEARFRSFIKGGLRSISQRWPPKHKVKKKAWTKRGWYRCEGYKKRNHRVPVSILKDGNRINNIFVDHIVPVIDPLTGFTTWDELIERMFVEEEGLQVLCKSCHDRKTADERKKRNA